MIGCKFIDPDYDEDNSGNHENKKSNNKKRNNENKGVKLDLNKTKKKKTGGCC